jgi:hypothetical protein
MRTSDDRLCAPLWGGHTSVRGRAGKRHLWVDGPIEQHRGLVVSDVALDLDVLGVACLTKALNGFRQAQAPHRGQP